MPAGVLLINLGTPEAPTPEATRTYLREFLADPRVVEIPRALWWPILHFVILPRRPKVSAARYAQIWTSDGSPLRYHTEQQAKLLKGYLGERVRTPLVIDYAMRYGKPSIAEKIEALKAQGCTEILLLPLYPQYAASTTATAFDAAYAALAKMRDQPALRTVRDFHDDPGYIEALAAGVRDFWSKRGRPETLLMSFHGIPERSVRQGDPYETQCQRTAALLAEALNLTLDKYLVTFQSRFGRARWLQPYTAEVLRELGRKKTETLDVICPGFTGDCLETLEEIAIEGKSLFLQAGGKDFRYIPCLNERHEWLDALCNLTVRQLAGWLPDASADVKAPATAMPHIYP
jgi:ferrochelatase